MKTVPDGWGLRWASRELTDAAGELWPMGAEDREVEKILAQVIRVASCVALGLAAGGAEEAEEKLSEARGAAAALAARVHMAVDRGVVTAGAGLEVRKKIRVLVDEVDLRRYRIRRLAG